CSIIATRTQAILSDRQNDGNGERATEIQSANTNNRLRAPQDQTAAATTNDLTPIIVNATLGDRDAQVSLGNMHREGNGVEKDFQEAHYWFLKAANVGDPSAQNSFGDPHRLGEGVPHDFSKAMDWYLKAAEQEMQLGSTTWVRCTAIVEVFYRNMRKPWIGISRSPTKASSRLSTGWKTFIIKALTPDKISPKPCHWYIKAAEQGHSDSQLAVA
ncbi:hypothetical protein BGX33_007883, partial [Mortierella sp. NVP41]